MTQRPDAPEDPDRETPTQAVLRATQRKPRSLWWYGAYGFTGLWIAYVLVQTQGDPDHPMFELIFIVPLGVWLLGLLVQGLWLWWTRRRGGGA